MDDGRLGMRRQIPRRDFLDGIATSLGTAALGRGGDAAGAAYPPALEGLRGQYDASYAIAHRLRDGTFWQSAGEPRDTGETYDLVVAGAGISGLAAAYFYRRHRRDARILLLDTLDDFGGHAKRNEFRVGTRTLLSNGGTQSIESPGRYSPVARGLLRELGVDTNRFYRYYDRHRYDGLGTGVFFDRETFGRNRLVGGLGTRPWREFLSEAPLHPAVKRDIERLYTSAVDYWPQFDRAEKRRKLERISYARFLTDVCRCDPGVLPFFKTWTNDLFGLDVDAVSALDVYESGDDYGFVVFPGFAGLRLDGSAPNAPRSEPYIFHFPDGNATLARLLVRAMIPGVLGGSTMEDVVLSKADYGRLDVATNAVRIRLSATVARVENIAGGREGVRVAYVHGKRLHSVRARHAILGCWNTVVPYVCPEVSREQREALAYAVKVPLVYTHVAIRDWRPFARLGVRAIHAPGSYHSLVALDFPVDIGAYRSPKTPAEPMVLWLLRTPCSPGLSNREQYRAGRAELYTTSFATIERKTRAQLAAMLGAAGFDPARDIAGITVNRWSHGYAYEYSTLWDPPFAAGETPAERGRRPIGNISIANSDSGASAYTDAAIDQAYRAVCEQVRRQS